MKACPFQVVRVHRNDQGQLVCPTTAWPCYKKKKRILLEDGSLSLSVERYHLCLHRPGYHRTGNQPSTSELVLMTKMHLWQDDDRGSVARLQCQFRSCRTRECRTLTLPGRAGLCISFVSFCCAEEIMWFGWCQQLPLTRCPHEVQLSTSGVNQVHLQHRKQHLVSEHTWNKCLVPFFFLPFFFF